MPALEDVLFPLRRRDVAARSSGLGGAIAVVGCDRPDPAAAARDRRGGAHAPADENLIVAVQQVRRENTFSESVFRALPASPPPPPYHISAPRVFSRQSLGRRAALSPQVVASPAARAVVPVLPAAARPTPTNTYGGSLGAGLLLLTVVAATRARSPHDVPPQARRPGVRTPVVPAAACGERRARRADTPDAASPAASTAASARARSLAARDDDDDTSRSARAWRARVERGGSVRPRGSLVVARDELGREPTDRAEQVEHGALHGNFEGELEFTIAGRAS